MGLNLQIAEENLADRGPAFEQRVEEASVCRRIADGPDHLRDSSTTRENTGLQDQLPTISPRRANGADVFALGLVGVVAAVKNRCRSHFPGEFIVFFLPASVGRT